MFYLFFYVAVYPSNMEQSCSYVWFNNSMTELISHSLFIYYTNLSCLCPSSCKYIQISVMGAWNGLFDTRKHCGHMCVEPKSSDEFWLVSHIFIRADALCSACFGPLQGKSFWFETNFLSFLAGQCKIKWRRMTTEWHSPLGFSCYTSSSSCLSGRFRTAECTSEFKP